MELYEHLLNIVQMLNQLYTNRTKKTASTQIILVSTCNVFDRMRKSATFCMRMLLRDKNHKGETTKDTPGEGERLTPSRFKSN